MTVTDAPTDWVATATKRTTIGPVTVWNADARRLTEYVTEPVDLVVTSPPYNVGIGYSTHNDALPMGRWLELLAAAWRNCYQVMAAGARICVVVMAGNGRAPYVPVAAQISRLLDEAGFEHMAEIIWDKGRAVAASRTSWGSWRSSSAPCIRDRTERIIVARKPGALPVPPLPADWLPADVFTELTQDLWEVRPESARRVGHPAPFPVELARRLIRLYAFPGARVLDPFAGSGTVGVAAIRLGCRATLVDIDAAYCDLAARRCAGVRPLLLQEVSTP
jgi:site-specific DNA-methyltransferase (adenine-specific)